jgi:hypothetical protein
MLADTGTLSGAGALPGLVPSSCAYLSTGEVLLDGSSLPPDGDASSGRLPSPSGLPDGEDGDGGLFDEGRGRATRRRTRRVRLAPGRMAALSAALLALCKYKRTTRRRC